MWCAYAGKTKRNYPKRVAFPLLKTSHDAAYLAYLWLLTLGAAFLIGKGASGPQAGESLQQRKRLPAHFKVAVVEGTV